MLSNIYINYILVIINNGKYLYNGKSLQAISLACTLFEWTIIDTFYHNCIHGQKIKKHRKYYEIKFKCCHTLLLILKIFHKSFQTTSALHLI